MVAIVGRLLVHNPPVVVQCRVVLTPLHRLVVPVMAAGEASTVSVCVTRPQEPPMV